MASLTVFNRSGDEVGTYDIEPSEFATRISRQLLHDVVVMYQANQRRGTQKTKNRSEVSGSTKKLYRQKGTGNARAGSRRSGTRRGGGHIKHRNNRDWSYRLPRKALQVAARMAMAAKIRDGQVVVLDELSFGEPKTREMAAMLKALKLSESSVLVATAAHDATVYKSARNIPRVSVSPAAELNAYTVLAPQRLLVTRAALDALRERLKKPVREAAGESA